jgi:hypothetical protein
MELSGPELSPRRQGEIMATTGGASVVLARAVSQSCPLDNFPDDGNKGRLEKAKNKLVAKKGTSSQKWFECKALIV